MDFPIIPYTGDSWGQFLFLREIVKSHVFDTTTKDLLNFMQAMDILHFVL